MRQQPSCFIACLLATGRDLQRIPVQEYRIKRLASRENVAGMAFVATSGYVTAT
jgi:hypothetical protein